MVRCDSTKSVANINTSTPFRCEGKCAFSFSYNTAYIDKIENAQEIYLSFAIEQNQAGMAKFNSASYTPKEVRVYQPSLHTYNRSTRAAAEVIVVHESITGGLLYVCSPLAIGGSAGRLDGIIAQCAARVPTTKQVALRRRIDIGDFVHDSPFYTYSGSCGTRYVVYAPPNTATYSKSSSDILADILPKRVIMATVQRSVEVNPAGPIGVEGGSSDIYIECNPTGESGESISTPFSAASSGSVYSLDGIQNYGWIFTSFIAAIIMIVLWAAFGRLMRAIFGPANMEPVDTGAAPEQ